MDYTQLFSLSGRQALVVGAGHGIGAACAEGLAAFGADVICGDLDRAAAMRVSKALPGNSRAVGIDITSLASVREAMAACERLEILLVTPGLNRRLPIADLDDDTFSEIVGLNLLGTFRVLREAARVMTASGPGSMIVFTSIRALVVERGQAAYAASKAGLAQLVRAFAEELGPAGIRVNAIAPGPVETRLTEAIRSNKAWADAYAAKTALNRWARPSELVGAVVYLASSASSYVTGTQLLVDGGWTAIDGRYVPPLTPSQR